MKYIFGLSLIAALACTAWSLGSAEVEAFSHLCMAETKVTEKDVNDFYSSDAKFNAGTPNLQCHLKCVMEKMGELKDGVLDLEKIMKDWKEVPELAQHKITDPKIFTDCKNEKGANDCETAFKIQKCIRKGKPAK